MARGKGWRDLDVGAFGTQNAERIQAAQAAAERVDPRFQPPVSIEGGREEEVQGATIVELRRLDYTVLQTSVRFRMVRCPACDHVFHNHADTGQSPGIPDTLVHASAWPVSSLWLGLEIKGAKTPLSKRQKELQSETAIVVARTVAQAVAFVAAVDSAFEQLQGGTDDQ